MTEQVPGRAHRSTELLLRRYPRVSLAALKISPAMRFAAPAPTGGLIAHPNGCAKPVAFDCPSLCSHRGRTLPVPVTGDGGGADLSHSCRVVFADSRSVSQQHPHQKITLCSGERQILFGGRWPASRLPGIETRQYVVRSDGCGCFFLRAKRAEHCLWRLALPIHRYD